VRENKIKGSVPDYFKEIESERMQRGHEIYPHYRQKDNKWKEFQEFKNK